MPASNDIISD